MKYQVNEKKNEESLGDLWDTIKRNHIHIMGILGEEKKKGTKSIFKAIMAENFLNLGRKMVIQIHETQRILQKLNPKRTTQRLITFKLLEVEDREF